MLAPPFIAVSATTRPLPDHRPSPPCVWLVWPSPPMLAYRAPAYTHDQPLRRYVRALQTARWRRHWEVASIEPGLDLAAGAPGGWTLAAKRPCRAYPVGPIATPLRVPDERARQSARRR